MNDSEYAPLLLSTPEMVDAFWPQVEPLLAGAPVTTEYPVSVLYDAVKRKDMNVFVVYKMVELIPTVELVVLMAPALYPNLPTMVILTVAGKNLLKFARMFWEPLKGWIKMNGMKAIDAYVPERMEALMKRLGLSRETIHVRTCI